jgi:hypothetical protein
MNVPICENNTHGGALSAPPVLCNDEIWHDVIGFDGVYKVSNYGHIWSSITNNLRKPRLCKGYLGLNLRRNGKDCFRSIHRIVAEAFLPDHSFEQWQVNHKNANKLDNTVNNLEWVTPKDNMLHAYRHGMFDDYMAKRNKSGVVGVFAHRHGYRACIHYDGKHIYLGQYKTFNGAVAARRDAEMRYKLKYAKKLQNGNCTK